MASAPPLPLECTASADLSKVWALCVDTRGIFEKVLRSALEIRSRNHGGELVEDTCLYASLLLRTCLNRFAPCEARIHGGCAEDARGLQDRQGNWRGHYWVQGRTTDGLEFLADITADQFGWDPVTLVVEPASCTRYRSEGWEQAERDAEELELSCQAAANPAG